MRTANDNDLLALCYRRVSSEAEILLMGAVFGAILGLAFAIGF